MRIVTFFGGSIQHNGDWIMKRSRINEVIRDMEALIKVEPAGLAECGA